MIQSGSYINIVDNSGGKTACCIKVIKGFRKRYAKMGDLIVVTVKSLRSKRKATSKVKKGEIHNALVVRTKNSIKGFSHDSISFFENSVILLNKQKKALGTRIFGPLLKNFRFTKFLKILTLCNGLCQ